jgi:hypothetical protein
MLIPLLLGVLAAAAGAALLLVRPWAAAWLSVFLLYTNLPVVVSERAELPSAAAALVPLLLVPVLGRELVLRRRPLVVDRPFQLMLAFLAVLLVSAFSAEGPGIALGRIGAFVAEGLAIYFLVVNSVRELATLRTLMWAVLCAASFLAALAAWQAVSRNYEQDFYGLASRDLSNVETVPLYERELTAGDDDRARGPVNDPNRFAQILLMAAPLVLPLAAGRRRGLQVAAAAGAGLLLATVLLTYSRGAFLTMVILSLLLPFLRVIRPSRLVPALIVGVLLTPLFAPGYVERVGSIANAAGLFESSGVEADPVTRGRTTEMLAALAAYADHPIVGVGPGQYLHFHSVRYQSRPGISLRELPQPRRAHDLYLEIAAETGTLGLAAFMAIPLMLLIQLWRLVRKLHDHRPDLARYASAFALVLLSYLGTGVFLHLAFERYYWLMIALTSCAVRLLISAEAPPRPEPRGVGSRPADMPLGERTCYAS